MLRCNLCISRKNIFKIKVLFPNIHTSINAYLCLYWSVLSFYTVITVAAFYSNKTFIWRRQRLSSNGRWRHVSTGARLSIKADSQLDLNLFLSLLLPFSKKTKKNKTKPKYLWIHKPLDIYWCGRWNIFFSFSSNPLSFKAVEPRADLNCCSPHPEQYRLVNLTHWASNRCWRESIMLYLPNITIIWFGGFLWEVRR